MINQHLSHRCLLTDIASGEDMHSGKPNQTLQTLLMIGFITRARVSANRFQLMLTDAGHRYLAGLWH